MSLNFSFRLFAFNGFEISENGGLWLDGFRLNPLLAKRSYDFWGDFIVFAKFCDWDALWPKLPPVESKVDGVRKARFFSVILKTGTTFSP